jgi:glycosyltransferase involved in cell wall biosynthesis
LGGASAIIVLASEFKDRLVNWGFDEEKIVLETTAVDDNLLKSLDIIDHRKRFKSKSNFNILFLARIEKAKGIYDAIDTYKILRSRFPAVSMTVAGDGSELLQVKDYVSRNRIEGIEFLGWVDNESKRNAYLDADLYLFPTSWGEGMPNSVLEAMGFGLPVITRPVGGLTDFFEDGKMGYIMDSTSCVDLASKCEKFIDDPEFRIGVCEYNHRYAMNRFLASRVARRIEGIYQNALAKEK